MEICKKNVFFIYLGVLMFLSAQVSNFSSATDTISTNQPLSGLEKIVSSGDIFELGFFSSSPSFYSRNFCYVGMWYKQVSTRTIVWVANREYPVQDGIYSSDLMISNGNLILQNKHNKTIWSTGLISSSSKDVQAVLLDTGNLVLRDTSSEVVLWQSFDHPSDTWLPCAKLKLGSQLLTSWKSLTDPSPGLYSLEFDPKTQSLVTFWNGSKSYWLSGPLDDRLKTFKGFPGTDLSFKFNLDESYITYSVDPQSTYRLVMDVSGQFKVQSLNVDVWNQMWAQPKRTCRFIIFVDRLGFAMKKKSFRPVNVFMVSDKHFVKIRGGCTRKTKLQCGNGNNTFHAMENIKLDTDPTTLVFTASLVTTCASACLANCSCEAYAYDGNKCLMWTTNAFNLTKLDANQGYTFFLRLAIQTPQMQLQTSHLQLQTSHLQLQTSQLQLQTREKQRIIKSEGLCYSLYYHHY